jgi:hypothetical protein
VQIFAWLRKIKWKWYILSHIPFFFGGKNHQFFSKKEQFEKKEWSHFDLEFRGGTLFVPTFYFFAQVLETCSQLMLNLSWDAHIWYRIWKRNTRLYTKEYPDLEIAPMIIYHQQKLGFCNSQFVILMSWH